MKKSINFEIATDMLKTLPEEKHKTVQQALERNFYLTSCYCFSFVELEIYKEGFYLVLSGTRCEVKIWVNDNDGVLVHARKPRKTNLLYKCNLSNMFSESYFSNLF